MQSCSFLSSQLRPSCRASQLGSETCGNRILWENCRALEVRRLITASSARQGLLLCAREKDSMGLLQYELRAAMRKWSAPCLAILMACAAPVAATAQNYPTHPIVLVSPFPPGGNVSLVARIV